MSHEIEVNFDKFLGRLSYSINREEAAVFEVAGVEETSGLNLIAASVANSEQAPEINYSSNSGVDVGWNNDRSF